MGLAGERRVYDCEIEENIVLDQLQLTAGLGLKDWALLVGGVVLMVALVLIGISGGSKRRGWIFYLGLLGLIASLGAIGYGSMLRGSAQASA